ncbi:hypothetical protein PISL3812_08711 [Talaromyces islandicus]|uniref:Uncharacterized protein n=1 Tax=Talaromyces islandicus TaxID=28573 RepID=A0A0U1M9E8_TALIS|nr:hypothetical protein PISL3812_08711 [Talaromyces islandicus]
MSNDNPDPPPNRQTPSSAPPDSSLSKDNNNNNNNNNQTQGSKATNKDPSLLDRIQTSATGLLRDTITNPNAHALGSDLGLLGGAANGKASSSSSSSSTRWSGVNASQYYDSAAGVSSSSTSSSREYGAAYGASESFRSTQENHTQFGGLEDFDTNQAAHFQNDYGDEYNNTWDKGKGKASMSSYSPTIPMDHLYTSDEEYYEAAWIRHTAAAQKRSNNQLHNNTQNQQQAPQQYQIPTDQDGAAVVSLLSDPSFEPSFADDNDFYEDDADTAVPAPLTADEMRILDSFRRQQQQSSTATPHSTPNTITPHSLIPDIDTFLAENDSLGLRATSDAALRDVVLHNLPGAEDWMAVNDRYQDEVWGYLRPALEAASKEIEESNERDSEPAREGPAVRRLKMILRHMQL